MPAGSISLWRSCRRLCASKCLSTTGGEVWSARVRCMSACLACHDRSGPSHRIQITTIHMMRCSWHKPRSWQNCTRAGGPTAHAVLLWLGNVNPQRASPRRAWRSPLDILQEGPPQWGGQARQQGRWCPATSTHAGSAVAGPTLPAAHCAVRWPVPSRKVSHVKLAGTWRLISDLPSM